MNNVMVKGAEITKLENELVEVQDKVEKLKRTHEDLQTMIDRKTSEYNIYMAQRDADNKKEHAVILAEREKLNSDKEEFQQILLANRQEKATFEQQKRDLDLQRLKVDTLKQNVQEFITAMRRASGLLGF